MNLMEMMEREMRDDDAMTIIPEAAIMRLREFAKAYSEGNTFKVDDLVTPRKGAGLNGAGNPHIVVEIADPPIRVFEGNRYSDSFGLRQDIRVICIRGEEITAHWVESWDFEPYTGEGA